MTSPKQAVKITAACIEVIRSALAVVDQSLAPIEQDEVYRALTAHIRARRPENVSPLGVLPPPTDQIRDPRRGGGDNDERRP
jgi:hypothetical protein